MAITADFLNILSSSLSYFSDIFVAYGTFNDVVPTGHRLGKPGIYVVGGVPPFFFGLKI
jgi:hypothetical protein